MIAPAPNPANPMAKSTGHFWRFPDIEVRSAQCLLSGFSAETPDRDRHVSGDQSASDKPDFMAVW
tara:strand:- start:253 stop:447 length:195 start_codon:yes stop_codon:yes gene_type:complete